jgi:hypothetical protein
MQYRPAENRATKYKKESKKKQITEKWFTKGESGWMIDSKVLPVAYSLMYRFPGLLT